MEQLSGLDATFLALESSNQTGHVASLAVYDAAGLSGGSFHRAVRRALRERIHALPPLRRRLVPVPLDLDHPYWADDPELDLDYHVRRAALPAPGTDAQLESLVARLHAHPLDRARPLWEMTVIEGLEGGRVALYTKVHHAAVDGISGIALLHALSDAAAPAARSGGLRAVATVALEDVHCVRKACGASVNDVVLAITAHALRGYLERRGELPGDPLLAMVPVSLRSAADASAGGNDVTMTLADLATDEADPVERLLRIHRAMRAAKGVYDGVPPAVLRDLGGVGVGLIAGRALETLARTGLLDRMRPPFNVAVSNVPGPRETLSLGGAPMEAIFPVSVVAQGQGLNVTVVSYRGRLHFGLTSCRTLVPDLDDLARGFAEGLEALRKRVDALAARVEE